MTYNYGYSDLKHSYNLISGRLITREKEGGGQTPQDLRKQIQGFPASILQSSDNLYLETEAQGFREASRGLGRQFSRGSAGCLPVKASMVKGMEKGNP